MGYIGFPEFQSSSLLVTVSSVVGDPFGVNGPVVLAHDPDVHVLVLLVELQLDHVELGGTGRGGEKDHGGMVPPTEREQFVVG